MIWRRLVPAVAAIATVAAALPLAAGLEELAGRGEWGQVVAVALRRGEQLPLRPDEAYIAGVAAGAIGDRAAQVAFLELASQDGPLRDVAIVQLGRLLAAVDGPRAVELVLPLLRRSPTREVREEAVAVAIAALEGPLPPAARHELERLAPALPHALRRPLEVQLAATAGEGRRSRLCRVLESSARDVAALTAARELSSEPDLSSRERWLIAQALYRHAMYEEAEGLLGRLEEEGAQGAAPRWQVAFLAGRCAFRRGGFEEAAAWYRRAIARAGGGERGADLEVHLARALELGGKMEEALAAAQRAVRLRTSDERRLFLARLRLRLDQPDYARLGIARVRSRADRERGELLLGLYDLKAGRREPARRLLEGIHHRPWSAPAAVLAADIAAGDADWEGMVALLEDAGAGLPPFWAERARGLMVLAPPAVIQEWRARRAAEADASSDRQRRRGLAGWAALEVDAGALAAVRSRVAAETGLVAERSPPELEPSLAAGLWQRGLAGEAVRWDPGGLPRRDAASALWSAGQMLEHGAPDRAIVTADAAWRMAGGDIPVRVYPTELRRALYPLPWADLVRGAAAEHGVPWPLLAALVREESKWSPGAVSAVGARGLVQLMPGTARAAAHRLDGSSPTADQLFDPAVSLDLGAAELARLLGAYQGRSAPAVAAYNAGEEQAGLWLAECGGECSDARYVATISFAATRAYTSNVLAGATMYADLYPSERVSAPRLSRP